MNRLNTRRLSSRTPPRIGRTPPRIPRPTVIKSKTTTTHPSKFAVRVLMFDGLPEGPCGPTSFILIHDDVDFLQSNDPKRTHAISLDEIFMARAKELRAPVKEWSAGRTWKYHGYGDTDFLDCLIINVEPADYLNDSILLEDTEEELKLYEVHTKYFSPGFIRRMENDGRASALHGRALRRYESNSSLSFELGSDDDNPRHNLVSPEAVLRSAMIRGQWMSDISQSSGDGGDDNPQERREQPRRTRVVSPQHLVHGSPVKKVRIRLKHVEIRCLLVVGNNWALTYASLTTRMGYGKSVRKAQRDSLCRRLRKLVWAWVTLAPAVVVEDPDAGKWTVIGDVMEYLDLSCTADVDKLVIGEDFQPVVNWDRDLLERISLDDEE